MDEDAFIRRCQETAEGLTRLAGGQRRWPEDLKAAIMAYAARRRTEGESDNAIAQRLGLYQSTLSRWRREAERAGERFRPVAIVPSLEAETLLASPAGSLQLITPAGYRVEGLDLDTLVTLLRSLEIGSRPNDHDDLSWRGFRLLGKYRVSSSSS